MANYLKSRIFVRIFLHWWFLAIIVEMYSDIVSETDNKYCVNSFEWYLLNHPVYQAYDTTYYP